MNSNTTFANREVCDLIFLEYNSKKPFLNLDFANTTTTEITGEPVYAYGGQGHPKRVVFHGDRGGTISFETQIRTAKLYSLITGGDIDNTAKFLKREVVTCTTAKQLIIKEVPVAGSVNVFAEDDDCGVALKVTVATGSGADGKTITAEDATAGNKYIVYYIVALTEKVHKISIKASTFPKSFIVYGSTYEKTEDDQIIPYKMVAYKCSPQTQFSMSCANTGDPATLTITCDLMADDDDNVLDLIWQDGE